MLHPTLLVLVSVACVSLTAASLWTQTCQADKYEAKIQTGADAIIGGVLSMHDEGENGFGCGSVTSDMQAYEAIRWALELLNKKDQILNGDNLTDTYVPGIKLGMVVRDYCSREEGALYAAEEFFPQFSSDSRGCTRTPTGLTLGIVGASGSDASERVANFATPYNIPVISFMATVPELSDAVRFPSFMRSIPPDGPLMKVIVEVIERLDWKYISVVYTENSHGQQSYNEFRARLGKKGECLTTAISTSPSDVQDSVINDVLDRLILSQTVGVLFFGTPKVAYALLERSNSAQYATELGKMQWIFTDSISLTKNFGTNNYPRGIISIVPTSRYIVEFEDHWVRINENSPSPENPWFQEWYAKQNDCSFSPNVINPNFPGTDCSTKIKQERAKRETFIQDRFVEPAVHAVFSYAVALRNAQKAVCTGSAVNTPCQDLKDMSSKTFLEDYLMKVDFTYGKQERVPSLASDQYAPYFSAAKVRYNSDGDIVNPAYDVWNLNDARQGGDSGGFKFRRVGTWINEGLTLDLNNVRMYDIGRTTALNPLPNSECPATGCRTCIGQAPSTNYLYVHGDIIVNGVFSIHNQGDNLFSCGSMNKNTRSGIQYLEAMVYALREVPRKFGVQFLQGVTLGGLGIDDCKSSSLSRNFISQVQSGSLVVRDTTGQTLDPRNVDAYVAAHTAGLTVPLAELMNEIERPLVGYASTSSELMNRRMYPYYLQVNPGVEDEMRAIVNILKKYGWNYVQTVHIQNLHSSMNANSVFRRLAAEHKICVVADHAMSSDVIANLRSRPSVRPVLVIGLEEHHKEFLEYVKSANATGEFAFLATSTFGTKRKVVEGYEDAADGFITLKWRVPDMSLFLTYLSSLRLDTNQQNPWFVEWFEESFDCYVDAEQRNGRTTPCPDRNRPVTGANDFELNDDSIFVITAIYAIANGLHTTLIEYCGQNYNGICSNFTISSTRKMRLVENIRASRFSLDNLNPPTEFSFNGYTGNFMVDVYNYQINSGYIKVGEFNPKTFRYTSQTGISDIRLYGGASPSSVTSSCSGSCVECLYMFQGMKYQYIDGDVIIPSIFDIHMGGMTQFSCGKMRVTNGFQYTEAFAYALKLINESPMLGNVRLGGLLLDGCSSSQRATSLFNNLLTGTLRLQDSNMMDIRLEDFLSWMSYESKSTIALSDIVSKVGMPIVSPAATAPLLEDKTRFSTFFRTVRSDMHVARAMATLVKELGFSHVITLNAPDFSSRETRDEFHKLVETEGVCILGNYEFVTDGNMDIILRSINDSTTQVVIVFTEPDQYVVEMLARKKQLYPSSRFIYIANRKWSLPADVRTTVLDSITFNFDSPMVPAFTTYLAAKRPGLDNPNPWFQEYYEEVYKCNLPGSFRYTVDCNPNFGVTDGNFIQDLRVLSTMNAVYSIAEGVRRTLIEKCSNLNAVCANFTTSSNTYERIMANMDAMSFNDVLGEFFQFIQREANRQYSMEQFISDGSQVKIGSYDNNTLSVTDITDLKGRFVNIRSTCDAECLACQESSTNFGDFTYRSGTFYFVGLFDVHKKGASPFTCGDINTKHGFELLEAFHYAIDYVNDKKGIFRDILSGIDIGAVGLDVCQSPTRAANLVANIHSGNINLRKGALTVNPRNFDVYIGTFETKASIRVADVLSALSIPQISYGATSLELRDEKKYRYFLRTVPADDKQARAIISYLKRFDIDNVQVISTFDSVGEKGKEEFLRLAYLNRICVSQNITIGETGPVYRTEAVETLRLVAQNQFAKVVVLFVDDPRPILQAAEEDDLIRGNYFFIGTDKWGMDLDMLSGLDRLIRNRKSVTLDVETADMPDFDEYLEGKTPSSYKDNPWFEDFFEEVHKCYVNNPSNDISRPCTPKDLGIPRAPGYIQDPYVLYVVNAVFSAAIGLHHAIKEVCGRDYTYACSLFRTSGERRQKIFRNIKAYGKFTDATMQPFYYTESGESDRGYHVYEPVPNPIGPGYVYKNVGSYNDTHYLKLDIRYDITEVSNCKPDRACQCVFPEYEPSRYMLKSSPFDLTLLYVGNIHQMDPRDMFSCGQINTNENFQRMMAFFYAIEAVNNNTNRRYPASLKFGGLALDTCSRPYRLGQDVYSLLSGEGLCGTGQLGQVISPSDLVAVIADGTSQALPISHMLSPLKITTLSPSATSVDLSNQQFHPYFLRTVPPDNVQAIVMLEIMKVFKWDYATVVYTNVPYGIAAKNTLLQQANVEGSSTCIAALERMNHDATMAEAEIIVDNLSQQVGSKVIILFTNRENSRLLLKATRAKSLTGRFIWLASDYWANSEYIVDGYEEEASGAVTIQIRSEEVQSFVNFMTSLSISNRRGIPDDWFEEFYQVMHECRLLTAKIKKEYSSICTGDEVITEDMIPMDPFVLHTIISVYITAQGLNNLEECRRQPQLEISACLALQKENRRDVIYNGIRTAQWTVLPTELKDKSFSFTFTDERYGDVGYNILNYHRDVTVERYVYTQIGSYKDVLTIDRSKYSGSGILSSGVIPGSQCPPGVTCSCLNIDGVTTHDYTRPSTSGAAYTDAIYKIDSNGNYYNSLTGQLVDVDKVPTVTGRFSDIWAIIIATIAGIGCFIALCMFIYLLVVYPNRGGTSILGYTLSFGIVLLYALVFAFIAHANEEICGLRRFALGFVYAMCYGSLFVKLVDCWRTQDKSEMDDIKYNKLGRPCGLFMVVVLLVLVQVIINTEWLILEPPNTVRILYNNQLWPRCTPDDFYDEGLVLSLVYVMLLILLSVIFGFATFSKSKNHYESRWILGIAVLSIPCWVIWCLVATIGVYKVRDAAVCVGLLINATFMLLLGPLRKLYLLNKYQAMIEEEEAEEEYVRSHRGPDYASTYGRQYDNVGRIHDGSTRGSTLGSTYPGQRYAPSSHMGTTRSTGSAYNPYADPRASTSTYPYAEPHIQREETQIQ